LDVIVAEVEEEVSHPGNNYILEIIIISGCSIIGVAVIINGILRYKTCKYLTEKVPSE